MYKNITRVNQNQLQLFRHFPSKEKGILPSLQHAIKVVSIRFYGLIFTEDLKFECVLDTFGHWLCRLYV